MKAKKYFLSSFFLLTLLFVKDFSSNSVHINNCKIIQKITRNCYNVNVTEFFYLRFYFFGFYVFLADFYNLQVFSKQVTWCPKIGGWDLQGCRENFIRE